MKTKRFLNISLASLFLVNMAYAQDYQFDFSEKKKSREGGDSNLFRFHISL